MRGIPIAYLCLGTLLGPYGSSVAEGANGAIDPAVISIAGLHGHVEGISGGNSVVIPRHLRTQHKTSGILSKRTKTSPFATRRANAESIAARRARHVLATGIARTGQETWLTPEERRKRGMEEAKSSPQLDHIGLEQLLVNPRTFMAVANRSSGALNELIADTGAEICRQYLKVAKHLVEQCQTQSAHALFYNRRMPGGSAWLPAEHVGKAKTTRDGYVTQSYVPLFLDREMAERYVAWRSKAMSHANLPEVVREHVKVEGDLVEVSIEHDLKPSNALGLVPISLETATCALANGWSFRGIELDETRQAETFFIPPGARLVSPIEDRSATSRKWLLDANARTYKRVPKWYAINQAKRHDTSEKDDVPPLPLKEAKQGNGDTDENDPDPKSGNATRPPASPMGIFRNVSPLWETISRLERQMILRAFRENGHHVPSTAEALSLRSGTLWRKIYGDDVLEHRVQTHRSSTKPDVVVPAPRPFIEVKSAVEQRLVRRALRLAEGDHEKAAQLLKISKGAMSSVVTRLRRLDGDANESGTGENPNDGNGDCGNGDVTPVLSSKSKHRPAAEYLNADTLLGRVARFERDLVSYALAKTSGDEIAAANILGTTRQTVRNKKEAYGLTGDEKLETRQSERAQTYLDSSSIKEAVKQFQRENILDALTHTDRNVPAAAKRLGIARSTLNPLMKRLGIR